MAIQQSTDRLRELALFAGAGGGILGGHLLGWRTVCAVEWDAYAASVLVARQNDGHLAPFPIWDDVQTFDGRPWQGRVDVVSGGFPCQDISSAGRGAGIDGERSGMWKHMARIIGEVRPRHVLVENSPVLTSRGLGRVLGDLAALGYDAQWGVLGAHHVGAPHKRDRIWIVAHANGSAEAQRGKRADDARGGAQRDGDGGGSASHRGKGSDAGAWQGARDVAHAKGMGVARGGVHGGNVIPSLDGRTAGGAVAGGAGPAHVAHARHVRGGNWAQPNKQESAAFAGRSEDVGDAEVARLEGRLDAEPVSPGLDGGSWQASSAEGMAYAERERQQGPGSQWYARDPAEDGQGETDHAFAEHAWHVWGIEPGMGRVAHGVARRVDRLRAIGNGQVPSVAALAWRILNGQG